MKELWLKRSGALYFLPISYCIWGAVTLRWITEFIEEQHPLTWAISIILIIFGILIGIEPIITTRSRVATHFYLFFQMGLIFLGSIFHFELDFIAMLYMILAGQASYILPIESSRRWLYTLIAVTAVALLIQFGVPNAFSFLMLYIAGIIFSYTFIQMVQQANREKEKSEALFNDLQLAHSQLQTFADQTEELAIANERTRLARDLHDSVAQTLYGLSMQAEAANRKLASGHTKDVTSYLSKIQEDATQTLQETRLLIYELRPPILESEGLSLALKARLNNVESRGKLIITDQIQEIEGLSSEIEYSLYRIAQEGLNNVAKYAQADNLKVLLEQNEDQIILSIIDDGIGFDFDAIPAGRVGLQGIQERVNQLNGRLTIITAPNQGCELKVEVPL